MTASNNGIITILAFVLLTGVMTACSGGEVEEGEHVWKEQEQAIERAEEVEKTMQDEFERRGEEIRRQTE